MSSTYSSSLRIELIGSGDQAGAWGATTDNSFAYVFDTAIAGYQAVPITSTSQALTYVNGATATANLNQAVYAMLKFTGASAATSVYIPPVSKQYILYNNSGYTITVYNSTVIGNTTAAGSGVSIVNGDAITVWSDGTNVYGIKSSGISGTLPIANGGTGQVTANAAFNALAPAQTANRLLKSDGTNTSFAQASLTTDVTGTLPVANGGTGVTTSTGSGNNVLSTSAALTTPTITSATLVTPALGIPTSGTLTNCTFPTLNQNTTGTAAGLSATLAVASGGTGVTTSTGSGNNVLSTSPTLVTPALGTPTSGNLANCTFPTLNQSTTGNAANVTGTVAIANGGTGLTSFTANYIHYGAFSTSSSLTYNGTDFTCGGNVTAYSDERFKTNWRNLPDNFVDQLAKVKHGVYDRTDENITQVGVSAQSLQLILEHAVIENEDGKLSVAYGNAALVAAIKLAERVVALEAKLDALTKE